MIPFSEKFHFQCPPHRLSITILVAICLLSILSGCHSNYHPQLTWGHGYYRSLGEQQPDEIISNDHVQTQQPTTTNNSTTPPLMIQLQPPLQSNVKINGTSATIGGGPHLVVSGRLVTPHQIVSPPQDVSVQPISQPSTLFRTPLNTSIHMRVPNFYYGTPLVVNHTIPIPHTPSHWRMALPSQPQPFLRQLELSSVPTVLNQTIGQITQPLKQVNNSTTSTLSKLNETSLDRSELKNETVDQLVDDQSQEISPTVEEQEQGSHRSLFSDFGASLFGGSKGKLLLKEEEDEYEEEKIELPSKKEKLLAKFDLKKEEKKLKVKVKPEYPSEGYDDGKKLGLPLKVAAPTAYPAGGYKAEDYEEEALIKPVKKLKIKKPLSKLEKVKAEEVEYLPGEYAPPLAANYNATYGHTGSIYPAPAAYPGHYHIDSRPKGKFIPQFRQFTGNNDTDTSNNSTSDLTNSTILETRATLNGVLVPSYGSYRSVMPGYLAKEVYSTSSYRSANSTKKPNSTTDDRKYNVFTSTLAKASPLLNLNSYTDPYGAQVYELGVDAPNSAYPPLAAAAYPALAAAVYPPPAPAAYPPPAAAAYPPPAPAAYPPPAAAAYPPSAPAAYPPPAAAAYPPPAAAAYPPPAPAAYPPPAPAAYPPPAAAAYPPPAPAAYPINSVPYPAASAYSSSTPTLAYPSSYPKILSQVLEYQYPAKSYSSPFLISNYSGKYDYPMPVAVVNLFCSDLQYSCSCTLYLTEINSNNMLISGICSGLQKDKYYLLNMYEYGDITAGCEALGLFYSPASSYAASNLMSNLGVIKSDYNGVAFVNKLKRDSLSVMCDKYSYKSSILGRAIGLAEASIPSLAIPLSVAPSTYQQPTLATASYRRNPAYSASSLPKLTAPLALTPSKVLACGVIGLANKDNSYETRELKSKLIASAEIEEQLQNRKYEEQQPISNNHEEKLI